LRRPPDIVMLFPTAPIVDEAVAIEPTTSAISLAIVATCDCLGSVAGNFREASVIDFCNSSRFFLYA